MTARTSLGGLAICVAVLVLPARPHAAIAFENVSSAAGITGGGTTFGASWGDFDGDGWPDLWVGNHDQPPALYLNRRDGTFQDISARVWHEHPRADDHGAAWADYDRDGDQDLIVVADAEYQRGRLIVAAGDDLLLRNRDGRLENVSKPLGVTVHQSSRTPLWLDADRDGRLDLLIVARRDTDSRSVFYRHTDAGFRPQPIGLNEEPATRTEHYLGLLRNVLDFRFRYPAEMIVTDHQESAQLADLSGDGIADLVFFGQPLRVYSTAGGLPFDDITFELGFPELTDIADGAIGDFDGNGRNDLFLTLGRYITSDFRQPERTRLDATIYGHGRKLSDVKGIDFTTAGPVSFELYPEWVAASQIRIGQSGRAPPSKRFTLDSADASVRGPIPDTLLEQGVVAVAFDPDRQRWQIRNSLRWQFVDVIVRSSAPIERVEPHRFERFAPKGTRVLLADRNGAFELVPGAVEQPELRACMSVAAGDFDNDMDLDVYAVCTGAVENRPNLLFENDGAGRFRLVPDAGGAAGSPLGRGDSVATADYDKDGFLDLFVTNGADPSSPFVTDGPHQLFRNVGNGNHWIEIDLVGTTSNVPGIGSRVDVVAGGITQFREQSGGMHRFSQNHNRLHFGLGAHRMVDAITVRWPSGAVQRLQDVPADRILEITEPLPEATPGPST